MRVVQSELLLDDLGSALLEFAIAVPLLVVFVVGIFDFSGAFDQKQKMAQAAQEGAIVAGAQPMSDISTTTPTPPGPSSLQPVVTAIFNSLAASRVLTNANQGTCTQPASPGWVPAAPVGLSWTYTITGCPDNLSITINRGAVLATPTLVKVVGTTVQVTYPYRWRFNSVIQLLFSGPTGYAAVTTISESATVHNQM